jgi:hypothetical protein
MAARLILRRSLRSKKGSAAVEFIFTTAMLILIFAVLVSALVYVTQFYSASYIARRVVRTIEVDGKYDEQAIRSLADGLGGTALEDLTITVDAQYLSGRRIQLRNEFTVHLTAVHRINIMMMQSTAVSINLPINISLSGRSEVYWK